MTVCSSTDSPPLFLSSPGTAALGPPLDPGTTLGRFTIVRHLGTGRGARVYLAHDAERGQDVALKIADLPPDLAPQVEGRMQRELDLRRALGGHPHVLALFDTYRMALGGLQLRLLSLEYADGGDFRQWLAQGRMTPGPRRAAGLQHVLEAARGLVALHRAGVVHFDVKPDNLFCVRGIWKIGDLDLACPVAEIADLPAMSGSAGTNSGRRGTEPYASPQAARPGSGPLDTRTDIYSLGVLLRETWETCRFVGSRSPRTNGRSAYESMRAILRRCLASDPHHRFQCVEQVIEALESELNREPTSPGKPFWPPADRQWRQARRYLQQGRARDARRICERLLQAGPHHPGAREVLAELDGQTAQTLKATEQLVVTSDPMPLSEGINAVHDLLELSPAHADLARLLDALEQQVGRCHTALVNSLHHLASARWSGFTGSLEEAAIQDPGHPAAADASAGARDLVGSLESLREAIGQAVRHRRYRRALRGTQRYRRCLSGLRRRVERLRAALDGPAGRSE